MKKETIFRSLTTLILALVLTTNSLVQVAFSRPPKASKKPSNEIPEKTAYSKQQTVDAATQNLLKRLKGSDRRVAKVIVGIVRRTNGQTEKIIGVGSHMLGNGTFKDPLVNNGTSDFDYRFVYKGDKATAIRRYKQLQKELREAILKEFGSDGKLILSKINLYPPEQVIGNIDDSAQAIKDLNNAGINPNLGKIQVDDTGKIIAQSIDVKTYDGLAGKGGKAFRDTYEASKGRVFWNNKGTVSSGFADILPFNEVRGIYTIEGSANTANQLKNFVEQNIREGDYRAALKNLKRTQEVMKKGRDLSRLSKKNYVDDLLDDLNKCCTEEVEKILSNGRKIKVTKIVEEALEEQFKNPQFRSRLRSAFKHVELDSAMLKEFALRGNPRELSILRELLEQGASASSGKWAKTRQALLELGDEFRQLGSRVPWGKVFKGLMAVLIAYQVYDVSKKASNEDWEGAYREAAFGSATEVAVTVGGVTLMLPVLVIQILVASFIDEVKASSYNRVASYQDCQDLIAGIYEVKGREAILVNQRYETSIKQLATKYNDPEDVLKEVGKHARMASRRGDKFEPKIEKSLNERCGKEVITKWQGKRLEIIGDAIVQLKKFKEAFASSLLVGESNPEEVWLLPEKPAKVDVRANLRGDLASIQQHLREFEKTIKSVGGYVTVNHYYKWIPLNLEDENLTSADQPVFDRERASRTFNFNEDGNKNLRLEYRIEVKVQTTADDVFDVAKSGYLNASLTKTVPFNINVLSAKGIAEIVGPQTAKANSNVNLTAKTDSDLQKLNPRFVWYDLTANSNPKGGKNYSFTPTEDERSKRFLLEVFAKINGEDMKVAQAEKTISIEEKSDDKKEDEDKTAKTEASPSPSPDRSDTETSTPKRLMFSGAAFDIWEGKNDENGFRMKRKPASSKGTGFCKWEAHVNAEVWGKLHPSFAPDNPQELDKKITEFAAESKRWGKTATPKGFSISDFKGKFSDTNVRFKSGGASPDAGYRSSDVSAEGRGWVLKDGRTIEIGYNVYGGGCWENSDRAFLESQAKAAQVEAQAIINSLTLTGDGTFAKNAYTGPKLDGSDMPKVSLTSNASGRVKIGDVIMIEVTIENAKPEDSPMQYNWSGEIKGTPEAAKTKTSVIFQPKKSGKQSVSVSVDGSQYFLGSDSIEFDVADFKAEIKQLTPQTKIAVGIPVEFSAQLISDGKPASGNYIYRFQPSPEVKFETNESANKNTKAVFSKPGKEKVWVQILEQKGDSLETVAESEQIEIEIIEPELKITFDQEKALVGKAVKAKVAVVPADLKEIDFRWEVSSNAKQTLESNDSKEITFIPQDNKPITVKVTARVPVSGDDLGEQTATITAQQFEVKVDVLGTIGPKPKVWKEGVGLVPVDKGIAVFQNVGLKATVTPTAQGLRYRWRLNEDSHFVGTSTSSEIRVNRSQTGSCEATVVVTDKDGIELGRGTASFYVSVSQAQLDNAQKANEATQKIKEAKGDFRKGKIDEAIKKAEEAIGLNPQNAEAKTLAQKWKQDRQTINTQMNKTRQLMSQSQFPEAQKEFIKAKNLNPYYKPVQELEVELRNAWSKYDGDIRLALGEIRVANERKDFQKALNLAKQLRANYKLREGADKDLTNYEQWAKTHEAEKERQRVILKRGEEKFWNKDYEGAIKDFDVMYPNFDNYWNINIDPEPKKYGDLKAEAVGYVNRINQLMSAIKGTAEYKSASAKMLNEALTKIDQVLEIQPNNQDAFKYRSIIQGRLDKAVTSQIGQIIKQGENFHSRKDYNAAIREFDKAIRLAPNSSDAYRQRGRSKREKGDFNGSLRDFNQAIKLEPNNYGAYLGRGLLYQIMKDTRQALNDFNRGIQLNPEIANGYYYRGNIKLAQKNNRGAIADYDECIRLNPKFTSAYINRGLAKSRLGDIKGALRDYNQAIVVNPQSSLAYNNRGTVKERLKDLKGAKADYEKALQINPNYGLARKNLNKLNAKLADNPSTTTRPTGNAEVNRIIERGKNYHVQKDYISAIREFDKAIQIAPNSSEAYFQRANSRRIKIKKLDSQGKIELNQAIRDYDRAIQLNPNDYRAFEGRGQAYYYLKNSRQAMNDLNQSLRINRNYESAYSSRGIIKFLQKDYQGALNDFNSYIRLNSGNASIYFNRGLAKHYLKDYQGALRDYNQAIALNSRYASAYRNRGTLKEGLNDLIGAKSDLETALKLNPGDASARKSLDRVIAKLNSGQPTRPPRTTQPPQTYTRSKYTFLPLDLSVVGGKKGKARKVKEIWVDDISWIRLSSTDKKTQLNIPVSSSFVANGVVVIMNLDNATYLEQGKTIATLLVVTDEKTYRYSIKAGIHASEWNYSATQPKHKWVENAYIGSDRFIYGFRLTKPGKIKEIRFEYVETGAQKYNGSAPGFCLRGVTLVGTSSQGSGRTTPPSSIRMNLTFVNLSSQAVHIFPEKNDTFSPRNRLEPSEATRIVGTGPKNGKIKIIAGRNGRVISYVLVPMIPNASYTVTFGRNNRLSFRRN